MKKNIQYIRFDRNSIVAMWKWLATILGTVIAGIIVWYFTEKTDSPIKPPVIEQGGSTGATESQPVIKPAINLRLSPGVLTYFSVAEISTEKGFARAPSELRFLLRANGNFSGNFEVFAFDKDGVKICSVPTDFGCVSDYFAIIFPSKGYSPPYKWKIDPVFWQKGEAQWAEIPLPYNTVEVQLSFSQEG